jgi:putative heme-binding domain-containing protein
MFRRLLLLLPPALAGQLFAVPEGFVMRPFAGPPEVDYPTAVMAAANGDVYVSCDRNGSLGRENNMGRIVRCRDTDGDGKADQFVDFVQSVNSPRGGHFTGGALYLIHPPFLSRFRDADGDGVAEEKTQLVSGLGGGIEHPRGADHTTNGVRMGIDGWLYISVGDFGATPAKGTDGSSVTLHGGGVLRVRPDGSRLEAYSVMVRNICDTAVSPELDLFSRDNTNDGKGWNTRFHHFTALADHGYPRLYQNFADEAVKPLADYGGGSGTGALWLSEPGFPAEFTDALFSTDWTTGTVHYHPWKRDGASFAIEQKTFVKLPHAIDIDVDGFSRLYLADWRNGGFNFAGPGKPVGMIHQAVYPAGKAAAYQDVSRADDAALVGLLGSSSAVQRLEAQREVLRRGRKPVFAKELAALAGDAARTVAVRTAAIFTLKQLERAESTRVLAGLAGDAKVREAALRAMADHPGEATDVPAKPYLDALADADPRVVLQALVGLQRLKPAGASAAILAASRGWKDEGTSPRLTHTAMQALASLAETPALLGGVAEPPTRKLALLALMRLHRTEVVDGLLVRFGKTSDADERFDILTALARLSQREKPWDGKTWWNTRPDDRGPYYEPIAWEQSPRLRTAIEAGFGRIDPARRDDMMSILAKNRLPVAELKLAGADPVLAALSAKEPDPAQLLLLTEAAKDPQRPFAQRLALYQAIGKSTAADAMPCRLAVLASWALEDAIAGETSQAIADFVNSPERAKETAALRNIAATKGDAASTIAWQAMLTVLRSPLAAADAKQTVQREVDRNPREAGFFHAIAALKADGFEPQIKVALASDNREVIAAATRARQVVAGAGASGRKVAETPANEVFQAAMTGKGDPATGARLFQSQGCIACHSIDPNAEQKGPYLGAAGAKFTRDYLIESILDPNKVVAQGFRTSLLKLKDGTAKLGFITGEVDGVVELRDISGQSSRIPRADVTEETHLPTSMMPPGLASGLSVTDFTSLIEYLVSLKAKGG